jgi:hypothetical protein
MATRHADAQEQGGAEALVALGGSLLPEAGFRPDGTEEQTRKQRRREAKLRRDAERPPDSFERFRMLAELVNEGRQVVELVDHKVRYALVVMGVLNAGVFFIMSRGGLIATLPETIKPWLIGFLITYAALTFLFVFYAVDCMRPRRLRYADVMSINGGGSDATVQHNPRGILFWETISRYDLDSYRRAWSTVRMEQLNAEVVIIAHQQAQLIRAKYASLGRLFFGLAVLVVLGAVLLAAYTGFALAH